MALLSHIEAPHEDSRRDQCSNSLAMGPNYDAGNSMRALFLLQSFLFYDTMTTTYIVVAHNVWSSPIFKTLVLFLLMHKGYIQEWNPGGADT